PAYRVGSAGPKVKLSIFTCTGPLPACGAVSFAGDPAETPAASANAHPKAMPVHFGVVFMDVLLLLSSSVARFVFCARGRGFAQLRIHDGQRVLAAHKLHVANPQIVAKLLSRHLHRPR